jgi:hypothetical protein
MKYQVHSHRGRQREAAAGALVILWRVHIYIMIRAEHETEVMET